MAGVWHCGRVAFVHCPRPGVHRGRVSVLCINPTSPPSHILQSRPRDQQYTSLSRLLHGSQFTHLAQSIPGSGLVPRPRFAADLRDYNSATTVPPRAVRLEPAKDRRSSLIEIAVSPSSLTLSLGSCFGQGVFPLLVLDSAR